MSPCTNRFLRFCFYILIIVDFIKKVVASRATIPLPFPWLTQRLTTLTILAIKYTATQAKIMFASVPCFKYAPTASAIINTSVIFIFVRLSILLTLQVFGLPPWHYLIIAITNAVTDIINADNEIIIVKFWTLIIHSLPLKLIQ